jgi:hypothetical protein
MLPRNIHRLYYNPFNGVNTFEHPINKPLYIVPGGYKEFTVTPKFGYHEAYVNEKGTVVAGKAFYNKFSKN